MFSFFRAPERRTKATRLADFAQQQVGYEARPNRVQPFGPDGLRWDGAFVDWCLKGAGVSTGSVSHAEPVHALQYYIHNKRAFSDPQVGDIAFLAWGKLGIVVETDHWYTEGWALIVEGESENATNGLANAVTEKRRYKNDLTIFFRPNFLYKFPPEKLDDKLPKVRAAHCKPGKPHRSIRLVQEALMQTVGLQDPRPAYWDAKTASAMRQWQRQLGEEPTGEASTTSLSALAEACGADWIVVP